MNTQHSIREAVGVFNDYDQMENAITQLEMSGFERRSISVRGSDAEMEKRFGKQNISTRLLEDHPNTPRSVDVKREELGVGQGVVIGMGMVIGIMGGIYVAQTITSIASIGVTIMVGSLMGGLLGTLCAVFLERRYNAFFQKQIDHGGLLLWVNTPDSLSESRALAVLEKCGAKHAHIHVVKAPEREGENTMHTTTYTLDDASAEVEHMVTEHAHLLEEDHMMADKIAALRVKLKALADDSDAITRREAMQIAEQIEEAHHYAEDMAEEEQRIVAESHQSAAGNEEEESHEYFALARELSELGEHYRRDVMPRAA